MTKRHVGLALASLGFWATIAGAQSVGGPVQVIASAETVPVPVDHAYGGVIALDINATDVGHRVFTVQERIPLHGERTVTLLYPRWEAASHGPSLTVTNLTALEVRASGQRVAWRRDPIEPHAFRIDVPNGAGELDVRFEMVAGADLLTPDVVAISWQQLILYPAGWYARNIPVSATLALPAGLHPFTSLATRSVDGTTVRFVTKSMETLVDSPVLAGRYAASIPLAEQQPGAVMLDLVGLRQGDLSIPTPRLDELRRLITQMRLVFGETPYQQYRVLVRLSDDGSAGGTEHRASTELALRSSLFREWDKQLLSRDLIAHEMVHAWNGLYRTPADLWAPTPNVPVSGSLLWVYEGQTEFWGRVLATRAGQFTSAELRDRVAIEAAEMAARPGRAWRPLSDDVNYPSFMLRQPVPWRDWQRRRDYYSEGVLLWLDVDAELRERSGGRRSIDDFAHLFYAGASPEAPARLYDFDAICRTLDAVAPSDWRYFLGSWLEAHEELDVTRGLKRHGWRLVFTDVPTPAFEQSEAEDGVADLSYSVGLTATDSGMVRAVSWSGPAFRAGMRTGVRIVAVGGVPYTRDVLLAAVRAALHVPIVLSVEQDGTRSDRMIGYRGTLRYPRLGRITEQADTLTKLLVAR
ncbi:peptidase M61 [Sphingomonas sp. LB3N6]|uniref:M61 family metallopeptidase n=1 Tax=Sphingomonas fucosidasi TaxID=3096164 RepID=UPI002FC6C9AE